MSEKIVILVHPGSLIAAKDLAGFRDFDGIKDEILAVPPENRFLVTGGLIPAEDYAVTRSLADLASQVNAAIEGEPSEEGLASAAREIWKALGDRQQNTICVTGAWADKVDGCVTCIYDTLVECGANVEVSELSPSLDTEDESLVI